MIGKNSASSLFTLGDSRIGTPMVEDNTDNIIRFAREPNAAEDRKFARKAGDRAALENAEGTST